MDRYEADKDIASAVVSPFMSRGVVDSAEALADLQTLGEPAELADAGVTFGDAAARVSATQRPGEPGGPGRRRR